MMPRRQRPMSKTESSNRCHALDQSTAAGPMSGPEFRAEMRTLVADVRDGRIGVSKARTMIAALHEARKMRELELTYGDVEV